MDSRIFNSIRYKELEQGILCEDPTNDEVYIPYSVISDQDTGYLENQRSVNYIFHRNSVSVTLENGAFSIAELYTGIHTIIRRKNLASHACYKEFSNLVHKIELFIYRDNGVEVNYRQMVRIHDLSLIFPHTVCDHLFTGQPDANCSECCFR